MSKDDAGNTVSNADSHDSDEADDDDKRSEDFSSVVAADDFDGCGGASE